MIGTLGFPEPVKFIHSSNKDLLRACCLPGTVPGAVRMYRMNTPQPLLPRHLLWAVFSAACRSCSQPQSCNCVIIAPSLLISLNAIKSRCGENRREIGDARIESGSRPGVRTEVGLELWLGGGLLPEVVCVGVAAALSRIPLSFLNW